MTGGQAALACALLALLAASTSACESTGSEGALRRLLDNGAKLQSAERAQQRAKGLVVQACVLQHSCLVRTLPGVNSFYVGHCR